MIVVAKVTSAGGACPFQVEGVTDKGEEVYARYRWGNLRVEVAGEVVYRWRKKEEPESDEARIASYRAVGMKEDMIEKMESSHKMMEEFCQGSISYHGYMTYDELREITAGVIQWPDNIGE
jgi:hypothetical protein